MSTFRVDEHASNYIVSSCTQPDRVVTAVINDTQELGDLYEMLTPVEQAGFLTTLAKTMAPRTVIDIGTFTGLSAMCFARGLAPGGRVYTCDVTEDWIHIARKHWEAAGVADCIQFVLGPARKTLPKLVRDGEADMVFVDADKLSYPHYVATAARLLRSGGLLILDNVLLNGTVFAPEEVEDDLRRYAAETLREVNAKLAVDERFETVMLPFADGVTLARKI
ncbi:methyltransferase domain-containing protein (plasmid) [Streptomyces finlayi]|uniref:Methyltransferase domain-containing protein n=1 Tax=Streptomyces finlayi TaxID=67296 RepID=A0A7G7BWE2_9ACTN|nr:class I SAM-dependent methyltransferase [Streptomyces finlayi]QNE79657.1 methyltransferase domain-containing protein [Streptomyces finlayi]